MTHDQARYPLATLVLVASARERAQRVRLLALARRESDARQANGIPPLDG